MDTPNAVAVSEFVRHLRQVRDEKIRKDHAARETELARKQQDITALAHQMRDAVFEKLKLAAEQGKCCVAFCVCYRFDHNSWCDTAYYVANKTVAMLNQTGLTASLANTTDYINEDIYEDDVPVVNAYIHVNFDSPFRQEDILAVRDPFFPVKGAKKCKTRKRVYGDR